MKHRLRPAYAKVGHDVIFGMTSQNLTNELEFWDYGRSEIPAGCQSLYKGL